MKQPEKSRWEGWPGEGKADGLLRPRDGPSQDHQGRRSGGSDRSSGSGAECSEIETPIRLLQTCELTGPRAQTGAEGVRPLIDRLENHPGALPPGENLILVDEAALLWQPDRLTPAIPEDPGTQGGSLGIMRSVYISVYTSVKRGCVVRRLRQQRKSRFQPVLQRSLHSSSVDARRTPSRGRFAAISARAFRRRARLMRWSARARSTLGAPRRHRRRGSPGVPAPSPRGRRGSSPSGGRDRRHTGHR